jgi:hypothetical protein
MGLLKDALNLGLITLDQYEDLSEEWSDLGYEARHYGDVESLQAMMQDFLDLGFTDLASAVYTEFDSAINYYEELYGYTIYYEVDSKRWRDEATGKWVKDPYEWIRD